MFPVIRKRIWLLGAAGVAGSALAMHFMGADASLRAFAYTVIFGVLWAGFRKAGFFAASMAVFLFACNILNDVLQQDVHAIPDMIGYIAGLCWLGTVQLLRLCAELNILNFRNGNKMY